MALARETGRGEPLATYYLRQARSAPTPRERVAHWQTAAWVFENIVEDPSRALEAMLRALAIERNNPEFLDEVDRLASRADAWERLDQVYEALKRSASSGSEVARLLQRHVAVKRQIDGEKTLAQPDDANTPTGPGPRRDWSDEPTNPLDGRRTQLGVVAPDSPSRGSVQRLRGQVQHLADISLRGRDTHSYSDPRDDEPEVLVVDDAVTEREPAYPNDEWEFFDEESMDSAEDTRPRTT